MSQHVSETCNESDGLWLPLTEYSVKSGVSLSTIRRKIKSNRIQYRLEKGRYLILFDDNRIESAPPVIKMESRPKPTPRLVERAETTPGMESVRMVSDAFEHALKEKDERIRLLEKRNKESEDRLKELQLLIRVLEEKFAVRY